MLRQRHRVTEKRRASREPEHLQVIDTGSERDIINVGAGVLTSPVGTNATTPEGNALTTDRDRTVDEITALLTIDGGGADYTGTLTGLDDTGVTDFNAGIFPGSKDEDARTRAVLRDLASAAG